MSLIIYLFGIVGKNWHRWDFYSSYIISIARG